jgi:hypothetical protein
MISEEKGKLLMKNQKITFTAILMAFSCLALCQAVQAVLPAPDGGYPGGNTAEGQAALLSLTTGGFNTAVGFYSLRSDTTGQLNTAIGAGTLLANTADKNTATGAGALLSNTTGNESTANGAFALFQNTSSANTADGAFALFNNTLGGSNTAVGCGALLVNTTGTANTAVGYGAGQGVVTANNVIAIGAFGADVSDSCYIGNIWNQSGGSQAVYVNSQGKLGALVSSQRFKDEIKPIGEASKAIYGLRPVSFRYKSEIEPMRSLSFGLLAEEVEKTSADLVTRDKEGKPYSVRYEQISVMLLNEFLKEHRAVEDLKKEIAALTATVKEQAAQIQTVSVQLAAASPSRSGLEMSKFATGRIRRSGPAPNVALNNP